MWCSAQVRLRKDVRGDSISLCEISPGIGWRADYMQPLLLVPYMKIPANNQVLFIGIPCKGEKEGKQQMEELVSQQSDLEAQEVALGGAVKPADEQV